MDIREITDKNIWDNFVTAQTKHTFLHSWAWGKFNEAMGDKVWRFGIYMGDSLIAAALVIKVHARRGNFLFVPHGPIGEYQVSSIKYQVFESLVQKLKEIAKKERASFVRISPLLERSEENGALFKKLGFRNAPIHMHAETTWELALNKSENELMAGMRKNTRNLVRRAQKEGVEIVTGTSEEFINAFLKLYKETADRQNFVAFSRSYIRSEVESFAQDNHALVFLATYKGQILSSAVIVFYGDSAYYHQGANSNANTKIPAAYLLQWEVIREAKRRGKKYYNFWGITNDEKNIKHPWYGLTFFKEGFGGHRQEYARAQDLPITSRYYIIFLIDAIRRIRRGL